MPNNIFSYDSIITFVYLFNSFLLLTNSFLLLTLM